MQKVDLAIIIPTLNEEAFIGKLLDSLTKQSLVPVDIIVVDAKSLDNTQQEVKKRRKVLPQLRFFSVKRSTIAAQRNFGARKTNCSHLLFLDADVLLSDSKTLERYMAETVFKHAAVAAASNVPLSSSLKDILYFWGMNVTFKLLQKIWPVALGTNLYVAHSVFTQLGGFDERIRIGEDIEFVQRAVKHGHKLVFVDSTTIATSPRRLVKEGRLQFSKKMVQSFLRVRRSGFANNATEYEFGTYQTARNGQPVV